MKSDKTLSRRIQDITECVVRSIGAKHMGGFDFAVQEFVDKTAAPRIYLIDVNTARYTAPMQSCVVMHKFGIKNRFAIRKNIKIRGDATFSNIIEAHCDVLFDPQSKVGVYGAS